MCKCDNFMEKIMLKNRQKRINDCFDEEGLTDEILNEQIEVNRKRHELDIHDENETVHTTCDDVEYVQ